MPARNRRTRGHIGELPSGSFRVVVYAGTDPLTGKPRQLRETAPDYDEAKKTLTRLQRQVDEDQHVRSGITVRQAIEQWLDVAQLEETTRDRYKELIRLYILPTFGDLQAAKVDPELLERFYARLQRCKRHVQRQAPHRPHLPPPVEHEHHADVTKSTSSAVQRSR